MTSIGFALRHISSHTENCSLTASNWRAQYFVEPDILVEDILVFTEQLMFTQNTTAFPFQECVSNWLEWTGEYEQSSATSLFFSCIRCTQSASGCLRCGATYEDPTTISFDADCDMLLISRVGDPAPRTYYSASAWHSAPQKEL